VDWISLLLPFLSELFENCPSSNAERARNIKRNGPIVQMRIRRILRSKGYRGRSLRSAARQAREDIVSASITEIESFICGLEEEAANSED
jgi:hypothetical protein|tara:strand:- start:219 stop:488 length:270 start_codon:yes stop_codon:yes gene_type:complete